MSSSVLTRTVMRRLVANQPIQHRDLFVRRLHAPARLLRRPVRGLRGQTQIRSIFSALSQSSGASAVYSFSREEMSLRKHAKALQEAHTSLLMKRRVDSKSELEQTFKAFFQESSEAQELVTDHQAVMLLSIFNFLTSNDQAEPSMSAATAEVALTSLAKFDHGRKDAGVLVENPAFGDAYCQLARQLADYLKKHNATKDHSELVALELQCFIRSGHAEDIEQRMQSVKDLHVWKAYVKSQESDQSLALDTLRLFQEYGPEPDDELTSMFVCSFVSAGQSDLARRLLHGSGLLKAQDAPLEPAARILDACIGISDSPTATEIIAKVDSVLEPGSTRRGMAAWCTQVARYKADGAQSADVADIIEQVFAKHSQSLTIDAINALVKDAYGANDPAAAKAVIGLSQQQELTQNGYTFLPQVFYKLRHGDLDGALATWDYILYDLEPLKVEDMAAPMEQLLLSILAAQEFKSDQFEELVENHPKYTRKFRPETVLALVEFYLKNESFEHAALLMRKHAPGMTSAARTQALQRVLAICHDPTISNECVFNIYNMVKALFEEAPRSSWEELLSIALKRNLKDKALDIFKHLRNHWIDAVRPTEQTYLLALAGFANSWSATQTVHNALKIDLQVEPTTALFNALMRAYTRCGQDEARAAVEFWDQLLDMEPGPNQDSAIRVLEACTVSPVGQEQAQQVWHTLAQRQMAVSVHLLAAYINNFVVSADDDAVKLLERETATRRLDHDQVLHSMFDLAVSDTQKVQVSHWLQKQFPTFWLSAQADALRNEVDRVHHRLTTVDLESY